MIIQDVQFLMVFQRGLNISIDIVGDIDNDIMCDIQMNNEEKEKMRDIKEQLRVEKHLMFHRRNWLRHSIAGTSPQGRSIPQCAMA